MSAIDEAIAHVPEGALEPEIDSKYRLIIVAAKRSKQLQRGAKPRIDIDSQKHKPTPGRARLRGSDPWPGPFSGSSWMNTFEPADLALNLVSVEYCSSSTSPCSPARRRLPGLPS
jgi:DNA-directed RNA polymerase omega subunit